MKHQKRYRLVIEVPTASVGFALETLSAHKATIIEHGPVVEVKGATAREVIIEEFSKGARTTPQIRAALKTSGRNPNAVYTIVREMVKAGVLRKKGDTYTPVSSANGKGH